MANEPILSGEQAERERAKVIEALTEHFAQDRLSMEELEARLDRVYAASTSSALSAVLADLPSPEAPLVAAPGAPVVHDREGVRSQKSLFAFMSGVVRKGPWEVPKMINAVAIMGGIELDLRFAHFTAPVTEIQILAVMGGVSVIVPPGVRVESNGFAIMGGFGNEVGEPASPNAPVVRLTGFALMGGVDVRVVMVGIEQPGFGQLR
jgi:hypothetical protein